MRVRALNARAIERFRAYLDRARNGDAAQPPRDLLDSTADTKEISVDIDCDAREFPNRLELGKYLTALLGSLDEDEVDGHTGLWAWLSLFYFDQVCPAAADSTRRPGRDYRHIPEFSYRGRHRHLLYGPYYIFRQHGVRSILLLSGRPSSENRIYHEIASRQNLIANRGVLEAAMLLYFDPATIGPKAGAQQSGTRPGSIRRFVKVLQQLDMTYDIYGLSGKQIVDLLPPEFDVWRPDSVLPMQRGARGRRA